MTAMAIKARAASAGAAKAGTGKASATPAELADPLATTGALCSQAVEGIAVDAAGKRSDVTWQLPEEVAVALQINSAPYTVMMATPANLTDFGIGFALAEGVVRNRSDGAPLDRRALGLWAVRG